MSAIRQPVSQPPSLAAAQTDADAEAAFASVVWVHEERASGRLKEYEGMRIAVLGRQVIDPSYKPKLSAVPKSEVAVAAAVLARYAGTYQFAPEFAIEITADGDKLFAQATGQQKLRVFASSPTRFFFKVVDAELDFATGADGKATAVTLLQGGREQVGRRR